MGDLEQSGASSPDNPPSRGNLLERLCPSLSYVLEKKLHDNRWKKQQLALVVRQLSIFGRPFTGEEKIWLASDLLSKDQQEQFLADPQISDLAERHTLDELLTKKPGETSWPVKEGIRQEFLKEVRQLKCLLSKLTEDFTQQMPAIAGVMHPDRVRNLDEAMRRRLGTPMEPGKAVEILEGLGRHLFLKNKGISQQLWKGVSYVDEFVNKFILTQLRNIRLSKLGEHKDKEDLAADFWERRSRSQPLASREGTHTQDFEGELLEGIKDWEELGRALGRLGQVHLEAGERLLEDEKEEIKKGIADKRNPDTVKREAGRNFHLKGQYPEAYVNRLDTDGNGDETHTKIDPGKAKILFVDEYGNVLIVSNEDFNNEANLAQEKIAIWLAETQRGERGRKPDVTRCGYTVSELIQMAGAGTGKNADDRYRTLRVYDRANGKILKWRELMENTVSVLTIGGEKDTARTFALSCPNTLHVDIEKDADGKLVRMKKITSVVDHAKIDGMPHKRMMLPIMREWVRRMAEGKKEEASTENLTNIGMTARIVAHEEAEIRVEEALRRDRYWEGLRMKNEATFNLSGKALVGACRNFQRLTTVGEGQKMNVLARQFAIHWLEEHVPSGKIRQLGRLCGRSPQWIKEQLADYIAPQEAGLNDQGKITSAFLAGMADLLLLGRWDKLPSVNFPVECFPKIDRRMGAALLTLDQELAGSVNKVAVALKKKEEAVLKEALSQCQKIFLERTLRMRAGMAPIQCGNGGMPGAIATALGGPKREMVIKALTGIIPGAVGMVPTARVLTASSTCSVITPTGEIQSLFDDEAVHDDIHSENPLGDKLFVTNFGATLEGMEDQGVSFGFQYDRRKRILEGDKNIYDLTGVVALSEPFLLRYITAPERREELMKTMEDIVRKNLVPGLNFDQLPVSVHDKRFEEEVRDFYRHSREFREKLQPVFDRVANEVTADYQQIVDVLIFAVGTDPDNLPAAWSEVPPMEKESFWDRFSLPQTPS